MTFVTWRHFARVSSWLFKQMNCSINVEQEDAKTAIFG